MAILNLTLEQETTLEELNDYLRWEIGRASCRERV